jgi:hypothetical protein
MDNYQNICQNNENSIDNSKVINNELKPEDFNSYEVTNNDGFHYTLVMHKSLHMLIVTKFVENITEGHWIWVDVNSQGRYQILDRDHKAKMKLIPAEFVREKYDQAMYFFSVYEYLKCELHTDKLETEDLESEINIHLIRLVNLLIHDMENIDHIDRAMDSDLSLIIHNIADNNDKFISDLMNIDDSGEWLSLKFNSNSYYLDESNGLQGNDNVSYYMAFHKTRKHVIFVRAVAQELEFKTTAMHHLYISEDDGLGRYKVQTKDDKILKQHFVPAGYVEGCYNRFMELYNNFKNLQDISDIYSRQTGWCDLQDNAIYLINELLRKLKSNLKQKIENSLDHSVVLMPFSSKIRNPRSFDEFYNRVVEADKRMRLELKGKTYPINLVIFNKRHKTTFIIYIKYSSNDIFSLHEKVRILISKYDPDYYVMVSEAWIPKNHEIQQCVSSNYQRGDIIKLPSHEKTEVLGFIGKIKNSRNRGPDKSEVYEIIRKKPNDENSRIIELRKFGEGGRLDFGMKYHDCV